MGESARQLYRLLARGSLVDARVIAAIAARYPEGTVRERRLFEIRNRWWVTL